MAARHGARSVYERGSQAAMRSGPSGQIEQTEEQMFEVLRTLVTSSPEARVLLDEVHRELETIMRLENLRKF